MKVYRRRLRQLVIRSLIDLALVAEHEKEDQLEQMFTKETVTPLLLALTGEGCPEISERHYEIAQAMLRIAYKRLNPQIPNEYRPSIIGTIDSNIFLLESIPISSRTIPPETVQAQREEMEKRRTNVIEKFRTRSNRFGVKNQKK